MKKIMIIAATLLCIVAVHACRKEKPDVVYAPTPLEVKVPDFVPKYVGIMPQPSDNPLTAEGVALGRQLFYEKKLSNTITLSCASCHQQANSFDDAKAFSEGTNGALGDRNAMPIINLAWSDHFFWDGRRNSLEDQAHDPVTNPVEMANDWRIVVQRLQEDPRYPELFFKAFGTRTVDSQLVVKALAQFERTLVSYNSRFDQFYYQEQAAALTLPEQRGLSIFTGKGLCNNCHLMNTLFTDKQFRNNGLDVQFKDDGLMKFTGKPSDRGKFKVPTLRNIAQTAPYMHDGRFATLEEVVDFYSGAVRQDSPNLDEHMPDFGSGLNLNQKEKADLVAFLKALSDTDFLTNPAFSDPNR